MKMKKETETPEARREKMRQEELKNPSGSFHGSSLADLVGGLSWIGTGVLIVVLLFGAGFFLLKSNPPLASGLVASTENHESVVIELVNNGFGDVKLSGVSVNNNETPLKAKLQVSSGGQGFIVTDKDESGEAKKYNFTDLEETAVKVNASPEDGSVSNEDEVYGLSIFHTDEIKNVEFEYRYFGMRFIHREYINALN